MGKRVMLAAGVLALLVAGAYVGIRAVVVNASAGDEPRRDVRATAREHIPEPGSDAERVVLTVELPAKGEPLRGGGPGHGPGCPQTEVSALLGIVIANPHGILIARAVPGGPAAEGGIMAGDSIVECDGQAVTCPSKLLPLYPSRLRPQMLYELRV